ncbi:hypothetical protein GRAN_1296 [Granulicella sibirica]|uniref:Uncharacterized protein n=1 Tax=Granulicella sibirica TaxID=2479048 RepID=A0A4Q0T8E0_9BACT|nr:hypothetical protein GRAN_1296 [Granulicella sibirica]
MRESSRDLIACLPAGRTQWASWVGWKRTWGRGGLIPVVREW